MNKMMKNGILYVCVALCAACAPLQQTESRAENPVKAADMPSLTEEEYAAWKAKIDRVGIYQEAPDSEYGRKYRAYMQRQRDRYDAELKKDPEFENKLREEIMKLPKDGDERYAPTPKHFDVYFERHKDDPEIKARFYYNFFYQNDGETAFHYNRTMPWLQYSPVFTADDYEEAMKYHLLSYECESKLTYEERLFFERKKNTPEYVKEGNKTFNAPWVPVLLGQQLEDEDLR